MMLIRPAAEEGEYNIFSAVRTYRSYSPAIMRMILYRMHAIRPPLRIEYTMTQHSIPSVVCRSDTVPYRTACERTKNIQALNRNSIPFFLLQDFQRNAFTEISLIYKVSHIAPQHFWGINARDIFVRPVYPYQY